MAVTIADVAEVPAWLRHPRRTGGRPQVTGHCDYPAKHLDREHDKGNPTEAGNAEISLLH